MMDRILFCVYVTYYKVYKNVLGLMLSNIEYICKVFKNIFTLKILENRMEHHGVPRPLLPTKKYDETGKCSV